MASVFLSYDRDDVAKARPIAAALEKAGHSVWWDLHVRGGTQFSKVIEEALKASEVVVVLWSANSIESAWVRDEAAAGRDTGRLVPVRLDEADPPLGFRQYQTIDLSRWRGRGSSPALKTLLDDVASTAGSSEQLADSPSVPASTTKPPSRTEPNRRRGKIALASALVLLLAGGLFWRAAARHDGAPIVTVTVADNSALSQSMTHDVMVHLGSLAGSPTTTFRLMDEGGRAKSDLKLSVSGSELGGKTQATLTLVAGAQGGVLWSRQLEQPSDQRPTLEEAAALASMAALACGSSPGYRKLGLDDLRAFIGACVSLDEGADTAPLLAVFRKTTQAAPRFVGGWANLLLAEAEMLRDARNQGDPIDAISGALRKDIASARKVDPAISEASIAEAQLLPPMSFLHIISMLDAANSSSPNDAEVLSARAAALANVGRMGDSVDDNQRAAQLKPFSPALRANYLVTLAAAGGIAKAWEELANAKRLWPDAPVIGQADYFINLRFGDFEKTWRAAGNPVDAGLAGYFKILRDPSDANIDAWINLAKTHRMLRPHRYFILQALGPLKRVDQLYAFLDQWPMEQDLQGVTYVLFRPWTANVRRDPRFMRFAQRLGLVDYWEKSGKWPDFCAEPDMPYDCRKEAAKLYS